MALLGTRGSDKSLYAENWKAFLTIPPYITLASPMCGMYRNRVDGEGERDGENEKKTPWGKRAKTFSSALAFFVLQPISITIRRGASRLLPSSRRDSFVLAPEAPFSDGSRADWDLRTHNSAMPDPPPPREGGARPNSPAHPKDPSPLCTVYPEASRSRNKEKRELWEEEEEEEGGGGKKLATAEESFFLVG